MNNVIKQTFQFATAVFIGLLSFFLSIGILLTFMMLVSSLSTLLV